MDATPILITPETRQLQLLVNGFLAGYHNIRTRDAYGGDLHDYLTWCLANQLAPLEADRTYLDLWARNLEDRQLAPKTINRRVGTIRTWYEWLIEEEHYLRPNPARRTKTPRPVPISERRALSRVHMQRLIEAANGHSPRAHAFVMLCGVSLLRISEATGLNIDDLGQDGYHRTIRIRGKGGTLNVAPLPLGVLAAVDRAIDGRHAGPILTNSAGRRMTRCNAARLLERLCHTAGVARITPHGLRRTGITISLQSGVPLRDVQLAARHASSQTTVGYDLGARSHDAHATHQLMREVA